MWCPVNTSPVGVFDILPVTNKPKDMSLCILSRVILRVEGSRWVGNVIKFFPFVQEIIFILVRDVYAS